jgi:hypothetical protein
MPALGSIVQFPEFSVETMPKFPFKFTSLSSLNMGRRPKSDPKWLKIRCNGKEYELDQRERLVTRPPHNARRNNLYRNAAAPPAPSVASASPVSQSGAMPPRALSPRDSSPPSASMDRAPAANPAPIAPSINTALPGYSDGISETPWSFSEEEQDQNQF